MKVLNLVYPEKSDIKYKISKFPDGQQQINILENLKDCEGFDITIKSRLNNFQDLELIICATKSIRNLFFGTKGICLYVPYFLGSRSDRQFEEGSNSYLKDVICPIINSLNFESVNVLDPHSDVLEACLNNFRKESNEEVVKFALGEIYDYDSNFGNSNMVLISPDAGASKKIYKIAREIEYDGEIAICNKERDGEGKLTKCDVNISVEARTKGKDLIIIDDICDGGGTFINIAKTIRENYITEGKLYLIVTHGIFSRGLTELEKYFTKIYSTNSYKDIQHESVGTIDTKMGPWRTTLYSVVKQLNVF